MEEVTSSSRAQESSTENKANTSESINSAFSHLISEEQDSSYTNLVEPTQKSSSPPISSQACESDTTDHQKSTNTDSLSPSDITRNNLKETSSNEVPKETSSKELTDATNDHLNSSSPVKTSIEETWSSDCEYSDSIREFREAFNCAVGTVLDIVKNRICWMCSNPSNTGVRELEELLRPLPPLVAPALKDAAVLMAAQKGEGHVMVHLLAIGARGDGTDCEKRNALHLACMGGWDNCVYILLDFKAISGTKGRARASSWDPKTNFEAVDVYSKTPLDYAKEKSPKSACAYYIERAIELQYNKRVRKVKKKS